MAFRTFCVTLQGTWFIQVGFILYNPLPGAIPWGDHDHNQIMLITTIFCLHMASVLCFMFVVGMVTYRANSMAKIVPDFDGVGYKQLQSDIALDPLCEP
jgi:hypothetical protein